MAQGQSAARRDLASSTDLEGRRPRATIIQGEPILDAKLLAPGQLADPITSIPKGFRLKTISVDAEKSAAGLLSPGDRVDVQLFVKRDERNGIDSAKTKVILQNIRVFAVDQTVQRSPDGGEDRTIAKTISLLLTPEQASKLTLAENLGQVSLTPRNPNDEAIGRHAGVLDRRFALGRRQEQPREGAGPDETKEEEPQDNGGLFSAIQQYMPPPKPPFVMEIVEAQDVREDEVRRRHGQADPRRRRSPARYRSRRRRHRAVDGPPRPVRTAMRPVPTIAEGFSRELQLTATDVSLSRLTFASHDVRL